MGSWQGKSEEQSGWPPGGGDIWAKPSTARRRWSGADLRKCSKQREQYVRRLYRRVRGGCWLFEGQESGCCAGGGREKESPPNPNFLVWIRDWLVLPQPPGQARPSPEHCGTQLPVAIPGMGKGLDSRC